MLQPIVNAGSRPLQPEDRLLLLVSRQAGNAEELGECISRGLQSRLPGGRPVPVFFSADSNPQLRDSLSAAGNADLVDSSVWKGNWEWIIFIEEKTTLIEQRLVDGGGSIGLGSIGIRRHSELYTFVQGRVFDTNTGRLIGHSSALSHATHDRGIGLLLVFGLPLIVPIERAIGDGSSATFCETFGGLMGDALIQAAAGSRPLR